MVNQKLYIETPISVKPEQDGIYMTKWKGVPAFTEKEFKDGEWQTRFDNTGLIICWLRPVSKEEYDREIAGIIIKSSLRHPSHRKRNLHK